MSPIAEWILLAGIVSSILLCVYSVAAPPPAPAPSAKLSPGRCLALLLLELLVLWHWLALGLPLIAWLLFIGDNPHWFWEWSTVVAAGVASAVVLAVGLRLTLGLVSDLYVQLVWRSSLVLLALASLFWAARWAPNASEWMLSRFVELIA